MHIDGGIRTIVGVLVPLQVRRGDACWRCGVPFALTDNEDLRRCAELAREAS